MVYPLCILNLYYFDKILPRKVSKIGYVTRKVRVRTIFRQEGPSCKIRKINMNSSSDTFQKKSIIENLVEKLTVLAWPKRT